MVRLRQSEIATALNSEQDLISYQIKTLEPLVLAEVSEGIGTSCLRRNLIGGKLCG